MKTTRISNLIAAALVGALALTSSDNPINRYLIKSPGEDKESNWLPAPDGPIYLIMRLYWPKTEAPSILPPGSGTWQPPAIEVGK